MKNHELINRYLKNGRSRSDIFEELTRGKPLSEAKIAFSIASIPQFELKEKFKSINIILLILLLALAILAILQGPINTKSILRASTPLFFSIFVFKFYGAIYRWIALSSAIDLLNIFSEKSISNIMSVANNATLLLVTVISFWIGTRVFPNLGLVEIKRGEGGKYLLK